MTLAKMAQIMGGRILQGEEGFPVMGISIDSRTLRPGEFFLALPGDRYDGHSFIPDALQRGAGGIILSRPEALAAPNGTSSPPQAGDAAQENAGLPSSIFNFQFSIFNFQSPCPCLWVADSLRALQELARAYRNRFDIPVIAITGSNGKTTTKELTASVLAQRFAVWKTPGNFNNLIGLPLTLLGLSARHQVVVVEMGMNRPGEIEHLCKIASPTVGVITNIGSAHMEFLGSIEGIQQAKGELVRSLREDHLLVVNADDPRVVELGQGFAGRVLRFGTRDQTDIQARQIQEKGLEGTRFLLRIGGEEVPVHLPLIGRHNVCNALAAAAVGHGLSLSLPEIREALEGFTGMKMRMHPYRLWDDVILIDDCYNANPNSMAAAIRTLANLKAAGGRSFLVIGDMLELGPRSETLHRQIGRFVTEQKIDVLITVGELARAAAEEAIRLGMNGERVQICRSHEEGAKILLARLKDQDRVLVKGSRGLTMEKLIHQLIEHQDNLIAEYGNPIRSS